LLPSGVFDRNPSIDSWFCANISIVELAMRAHPVPESKTPKSMDVEVVNSTHFIAVNGFFEPSRTAGREQILASGGLS
jgi:hypothetical protein